MIHYQFEVEAEFFLDENSYTKKLYSEISKPLVILTNENQWLRAEETILRTILFPENAPININKVIFL